MSESSSNPPQHSAVSPEKSSAGRTVKPTQSPVARRQTRLKMAGAATASLGTGLMIYGAVQSYEASASLQSAYANVEETGVDVQSLQDAFEAKSDQVMAVEAALVAFATSSLLYMGSQKSSSRGGSRPTSSPGLDR